MTEAPRTVFKIRAGRRARELGFLAGLVAGLLLACAVLGAAQVYLCRRAHPSADWVACLRRPLRP